jgi:hypothetical protein
MFAIVMLLDETCKYHRSYLPRSEKPKIWIRAQRPKPPSQMSSTAQHFERSGRIMSECRSYSCKVAEEGCSSCTGFS